MNKIVLIPDSFKGTMSSERIIAIEKKVISRYYPDAEVVGIPVADGGEGSVDAFLSSCGGERISVDVHGPYMEKTESFFGLLPDGTAVVEMAAAAGLPMVGDCKDPSATTTYGVGELLLAAAKRGARRIILGLGGSCTNDAGTGAAVACGVEFLDGDGNPFVPVGATLDKIADIDTTGLDESLKAIPIITMCDIDNPFYGPSGAAAVYGPQKGADKDMVEMLDGKMEFLASLIERKLSIDVQKIPGSGAAGGMGGGMVAFFSSSLKMGIDTVLDVTEFRKRAAGADFIFTGEGKIDTQSLRGKVVIGVAREAKSLDVPVVAFVGDIGNDIQKAYDEGVAAIFSTNRVAVPFKEAKLRAAEDLELTVDNFLRFMKRIGK